MARTTPRIERTCLVCDTPFEGTPKATRCQTCKNAGLRVPSARQSERRKEIIALKVERGEIEADLADPDIIEKTEEQLAEERRERRRQRFRDHTARLTKWLDERNRQAKRAGKPDDRPNLLDQYPDNLAVALGLAPPETVHPDDHHFYVHHPRQADNQKELIP